jgi:hypothetical protein
MYEHPLLTKIETYKTYDPFSMNREANPYPADNINETSRILFQKFQIIEVCWGSGQSRERNENPLSNVNALQSPLSPL